jgi:hypothetical protein
MDTSGKGQDEEHVVEAGEGAGLDVVEVGDALLHEPKGLAQSGDLDPVPLDLLHDLGQDGREGKRGQDFGRDGGGLVHVDGPCRHL